MDQKKFYGDCVLSSVLFLHLTSVKVAIPIQLTIFNVQTLMKSYRFAHPTVFFWENQYEITQRLSSKIVIQRLLLTLHCFSKNYTSENLILNVPTNANSNAKISICTSDIDHWDIQYGIK